MSRCTLDSAMSSFLSLTGLSPSLAGFPKTFLLKSTNQLCGPNPTVHAPWFGLFPFRSPLLWKSIFLSNERTCFFLFLRLLRCFSSPGSLPYVMDWRMDDWIHPAGFPHSDICGSMDICSSPQLFAAYHVFLRLLVPRHPPCALSCLTS